ncbi:MAG: tRNA (guanine(10)-N(2))-dimethyltransferase [Methanomassiliicoccales archaeon]
MSAISSAVEIIEGSTRILVPRDHSVRGPGKRVDVFYNRQNAFNRDISVMFFSALRFCGVALDGLAGTGVRAIRISNELNVDFEFIINDVNRLAFEFIKANIKLNRLDNCIASNSDVRTLLFEKGFDYIDLDPFGSPVFYIDAAIQNCHREGILAITATDTAVLAGTHTRKCMRRYGAHSIRCSFGHELALRILIGFLAREAAKFDRGILPLLCFYADHYLRVHLRLLDGAGNADDSLKQLGFIYFNHISKERSLTPRDDGVKIGPLWMGNLFDKDLLRNMTIFETLACKKRCSKYLEIWKNELDTPPFFYDINELASVLKVSPPPLAVVFEKLSKHGRVSKTHFSPRGLKCDIPYNELMSLIREISIS